MGLELLLFAAIVYAGARGVENVAATLDRRQHHEDAEKTVSRLASGGGSRFTGKATKKKPGPTEPGGTFSAAAPRSAKAGGRAAYPLAALTETSSTMWKAVAEGYRERWPEIREERRKAMTVRAARRKADKETARAKKQADQAAAKAGPPPSFPPKPATPPAAVSTGSEPENAIPAPAPTPEPRPSFDKEPADAGDEQAPATDSPEPADGHRHLTVVPSPAQIGDPMSSPASVIPEIQTLDGLMNALTLTKAMCEMRAEEAIAIAADDQSLADRLDQIEGEMAELEVDPITRGEIDSMREAIRAQSQAAAQYGAAAKDAGDFAAAAATSAHKAHGGIAEAVQSAPIEVAAQAGYYNH
ncbi:hypothetical protein [Streptomyces sp. NPDC059916]|uniref:hypothetical protein n=1 Tax=Streptomyces sp. NPDC059916 TaxID=3347001 RepID=UPI0036971A5F